MKWRDHSINRFLFDPLLDPIPGTCPRCGGSGTVLEQIDEERADVEIPCPQCQMWCKACRDWVKRAGHTCTVES